MNKIINNYNVWADQYDNNINPTRDLDKVVTQESLSDLNFSNVLELGCGSGKNTEWLITKADKLIGIDFSSRMLELARKKISSKNVSFICADLNEKWPVNNNSFDLATINLTLEHIKILDHIFNSLFVKLRKGGKCFVCELHPEKQLAGSKARFQDNGTEIVLDVFQHSELDYVQSAEKVGFSLLAKKDWYDDEKDLPRLISFLFEKPE
ncbi:MAG: SAM-dependent methyltransferase [Chloroflexi bacterium]|nr:SAM-dependent methyltransferase [Chloroflexota bacterium]|tara:strand:+ start:360 stop:986 length:627 start_codon:yes stop_codon:yes gene_type:complete